MREKRESERREREEKSRGERRRLEGGRRGGERDEENARSREVEGVKEEGGGR